jgi:hypothetical protein
MDSCWFALVALQHIVAAVPVLDVVLVLQSCTLPAHTMLQLMLLLRKLTLLPLSLVKTSLGMLPLMPPMLLVLHVVVVPHLPKKVMMVVHPPHTEISLALEPMPLLPATPVELELPQTATLSLMEAPSLEASSNTGKSY